MQNKNAAAKSSGKEDSDDDAEDDFERQVVSFLQVALVQRTRCLCCAALAEVLSRAISMGALSA